jgi:hypothetical protein
LIDLVEEPFDYVARAVQIRAKARMTQPGKDSGEVERRELSP